MRFSKKTLLSIGITGSIVTAICCFTPLLVVTLGVVGFSALVGYLDYFLLPALVAFVGIIFYALLRKTE